MAHWNGRKYLDDRMFILELCKGTKESDAPYTLITRRNCEGNPPVRVDNFESYDEAEKYIKKVEPQTPLLSLEGKPPSPQLTYEEFIKKLKEQRLLGCLEYTKNFSRKAEVKNR